MKSNREKIVVRTSIISIAANILLAGFKALVGFLSNSVAIMSDAINNFSDALSSIITIVGTKLAGKAPNKEHPYGYGRIEYMTSLIVSVIVLYAGVTAFIESVEKIFVPEEVNYDVVTLVVLIAGIVIKFVLGLYVKKKGKEIKSDSLVASGADAFNDAILSASVLASTIIYMIFGINLGAYAGVLLSIFIIKAGTELIKDSIDNVLGKRIESNLAKSIKKDIAEEKGVLGAFDLVIDDFGPGKHLGSVHVEVDDTLSATDIDKLSRNITQRIMEKYDITLHTVGIYSVNTKDKQTIAMREAIRKIVFEHDHVLQMHGFYVDKKEKLISFDIILDFKAKNYDEIYQNILKKIQEKYPKYKINITLDIDVSE